MMIVTGTSCPIKRWAMKQIAMFRHECRGALVGDVFLGSMASLLLNVPD